MGADHNFLWCVKWSDCFSTSRFLRLNFSWVMVRAFAQGWFFIDSDFSCDPIVWGGGSIRFRRPIRTVHYRGSWSVFGWV